MREAWVNREDRRMITLEHVTKTYGGFKAVDDVSFSALPGRVTGFLGPNGAGKSTSMRVVVGLTHADGGTATIGGHRYADIPNPGRHVGVLLDAAAQHAGRTGREVLLLGALTMGLPESRVDEMLTLVGLTEVAKAKPKGFSMGMGQRLGLAAALLGEPHTLILDEPANGLDPQGIQWMRLFLKSLAAEGRSIFVSSHLLSEMALMADHLVVIGKGRLIATGPVEDFVSSSRGNAVVVRTPDATAFAELLAASGAHVTPAEPGALTVAGMTVAAVGDLAFEHGIRLHELSPKVATLEEAFLERTAGAEEFQAHGGLAGDAS
jgi:ABC-2 type transport system ATP-binding protein